MVYIYLPCPGYIDGNSFRFYSPHQPLAFFLLFCSLMSGSSQFSIRCFHCQNGGVGEDVREKWNVPEIFALRFDQPARRAALPGGSGRPIWVRYLHILTKYWVSATRISCCDRLTGWALALQTLMQQRAALSGGNLPQAGRQRGTF